MCAPPCPAGPPAKDDLVAAPSATTATTAPDATAAPASPPGAAPAAGSATPSSTYSQDFETAELPDDGGIGGGGSAVVIGGEADDDGLGGYEDEEEEEQLRLAGAGFAAAGVVKWRLVGAEAGACSSRQVCMYSTVVVVVDLYCWSLALQPRQECTGLIELKLALSSTCHELMAHSPWSPLTTRVLASRPCPMPSLTFIPLPPHTGPTPCSVHALFHRPRRREQRRHV